MDVHASLCISLYWIGEQEYMLVILRMKPFQWVIINVIADLLRKILKVRIAEQDGIRSGRIITKEGPKRIEAFEAPKGKGNVCAAVCGIPFTLRKFNRRGSVVKMSVFGWRSFPDLLPIYGWRLTT